MRPSNWRNWEVDHFLVSQNHAAKIAQLLNEEATAQFPGKYHSDFAMQVTSSVQDSQQMSVRFSNNNLSGNTNYLPMYRSSKTRVCVTVGMMTTGYDCEDILNLCLMRPIFSPTDFIQIKGRGTRTFNFSKSLLDPKDKKAVGERKKLNFKLFDFFANCEYFENEFDYDQVLKLPKIKEAPPATQEEQNVIRDDSGDYDSLLPDAVKILQEIAVGPDGMRIDRMYFQKFEDRVRADPVIQKKVQTGDWSGLDSYIDLNHFNQPKEFYNLMKLRQALNIDRRITTRELIEFIFGQVPYIKSKNQLLDDEFEKFDNKYLPGERFFNDAKTFFKTYITDAEFRRIIDSGQFAMLNVNPNGNSFRNISPALRKQIPEYIKDHVALNQFMD